MMRRLLPLILATGISLPVQGDITLPPLISDHLLLQAPDAAIWGRADAGEKVSVSLAGREASTTADAEGKWRVLLKDLKPGRAGTMIISGANSRLEVRDVAVGEVWLASGQSNMVFPLANSEGAKEAIAALDDPEIRMFTVTQSYHSTPKEEVEGKWEVASPETVARWSAVGTYFAKELKRELGRPIGIITAAWGGTPAHAWTPREVLEGNPAFAKMAIEHWQQSVEQAGKPTPLVLEATGPARLYNAMIAPIAPYTLKGILWYQGERDAGRATWYRGLLPEMIAAWRAHWEAPNLPFLIVQLPNFHFKANDPSGENGWVLMREVQAQIAASVGHSGIIPTLDVGLANDLHPPRKREVGERLARLALGTIFGKEEIRWQAPTLETAFEREGKVHVRFVKGTAAGLKTSDDQPPKAFELAGEDGQFYPAQAAIAPVNRMAGSEPDLLLSTPKVPEPKAVRYGWKDAVEVNLTNAAGLPAFPFRTELQPAPSR